MSHAAISKKTDNYEIFIYIRCYFSPHSLSSHLVPDETFLVKMLVQSAQGVLAFSNGNAVPTLPLCNVNNTINETIHCDIFLPWVVIACNDDSISWTDGCSTTHLVICAPDHLFVAIMEVLIAWFSRVPSPACNAHILRPSHNCSSQSRSSRSRRAIFSLSLIRCLRSEIVLMTSICFDQQICHHTWREIIDYHFAEL